MRQTRFFKKCNFLMALIFGAGLVSASPSWADSRTATIRVSCTVVPMIEMSQKKALVARSNLGNRFHQSEHWVRRNGHNIRLVSITAL